MSEQYEISVVFGGDKEASVNRTFKTQREMFAYFCALDDFDGWLDSEVVEDGQMGWMAMADGTWQHIDPEYGEVDIETYNQVTSGYPEFAKEQE